ncbi:serine-rich adhesin for platelets-like [Sinocyclocheilus anshuiensis]|uniref:serine-rich adhesin for platelets-like n=2 Tax=Sinocyclocheilus anshuiensis TaxID=1608454 RepID=UPI0007B7DDA4|nr:PREDICTED: serine-rich adhesin for platelets-like [Sinocyclocheilus anshuiensis]
MSCINSTTAQTIPAASQITYSKAISSSSIRFEWSSAQGAEKYILVVNGTFHPETHNLTFTTLSGQIDNLQQATSYSCYIYSANSAGLGSKSLVKTIRTLVQPPNNVAVRELTQSMARVTWNNVSGVLLYQVSVIANNKPGFPLVLKNVTGTAANISNLEPCTTYTIGVASINMFLEPGEFINVTYLTSTISTVSSISVEYSCLTSTAMVSWDVVFGATSYHAVITDGQGRSLNCTSTDTTCQVLMLVCGERYSVRITAFANCESTSDGSYIFETAPCQPKALKLYRECSTNVILFSWDSTNNTAYYFAIAVDSDQLVTECLTVDTSCYFTDTVCGQTYSFYVRSIYSGGLDCNSGYTDGVVIKTAPCLPQNIYTIANCNSISSAVITWDEATGAETYIVEARGNRKDFYNCTSANTSCTLTDLDCGESLSVWIVATNGECTTDPVLGEVAETVPCIPQNVSAVKTCSSESASLTWDNANGAIFYIGSAKHIDGTIHTCAAMAAECTFPNLRCGEMYDYCICTLFIYNLFFHITSSSLAPCIPTNVAAALNCTSNIASITWHSALGATWYLVKAESSQGYKTSCNNTVTHCDIPNLQCGQEYSITVMGMNGVCMGPASLPFTLVSAPCHNTGIQASLDCRTNSALISWTPGNGSLSFNAILQSFQDPQKHNCFTNGSSCSISSLPCGQHYNISVTGYGRTCSTSSKTLVTLDTAPCVPTQVNVSLSCGSDTASVSWAASSGLVSYYTVTAVDDNGQTLTCNSSSTSCDISGLLCGQVYNVSVTAMSVDCTGQRSEVRRINTAPCAPQSVVSQLLDCRTGDVQISWQSSKGAQIYYAQAKSTDKTLVCNSTSKSCIIPAIGCGQTYNITVVAEANGCSSNASVTSQVTAAPCPPLNIQSIMNCDSNTTSVSWSSGNGALSFMMAMECSNGQRYICRTNETGCDITNMACGQTCTVKVVAEGRSCNSSEGTGSPVITGPCVPQNVLASVSCSSNIASVTWGSSRGAELYTVTASSANGLSANCTSTSTSCDLLTLTCGQSYTITVKAKGSNCSSGNSAPVQVQAVPCTPSNVLPTVDCVTNALVVSWTPGAGGQYYTATLQDSNGLSTTCQSTGSQCNVTGLRCGQLYHVNVTASDDLCSSPPSATVNTNSAPCAPVSVGVTRDCASNNVIVSWQALQDGSLYTAVLQDEHGPTVNCSTSSNNCTFADLLCGMNYNVTVTRNDGQCRSLPSTPIQIQSAPCDPQNITTVLQCDTNTANVTWAASAGANGYTAMATDGQQQRLASCHSMGTSCQLTSLPCGMRLNVTVQADDTTCNSSSQPKAVVVTAPCIPTNVAAALNCTSNIASITWHSALGATWYLVKAESSQGYKTSCNNTVTHCDIPNLQCGQEYSITVMGMNGVCMGPASLPFTLVSAPCHNTGIQASLDCRTNSALISWTPGNGSLSFNAILQSFQDPQKHNCFTNGSSCSISSLPCGQHYNISVTGYGRTCSTSSKTLVTLDTAPCVPTQVNVSLSCGSDTASVSWAASSGLVSYYTVTAVDDNGQTLTCNSSSTSCDISGLLCGQVYNVSVTAMSVDCTGQRSEVRRINTAPCAPQSVVSQLLDCRTGDVQISWQSSKGAQIYYAQAKSTDKTLVCNSTSKSCIIPAIGCGQTYNITVVAEANGCSSNASVTSQVTAAPCPPTFVTAVLDCSTNTVLVSWSSLGISGVHYTATAIGPLGPSSGVECTTTNFNCTLAHLQCGSQYNVTVTATKNNCTSKSSKDYSFITAPCVPVLNDVALNCSSRSAVVNWSGLSLDALSVSAVSSQGEQLGCGVFNNGSCVVEGLQCGQTYTFSANTTQGQCTSAASNTLQRETAPCPPLNIQSIMNCDSNTASVSWSSGNGALSFMMAMECSNGQRYICRTNETCPCVPQNVLASVSCSSNIASVTWGSSQGAELYTVTASSANGLSANCTSTSTSCDLLSPCVPQNVLASVSCSSNIASVTWGSSQGAELYTVTASSANGLSANCTSTSTSCDLLTLTCGQSYTITVKAKGSNCSSGNSAPVQVQAVPCTPSNVLPTVDCVTNALVVSWTPGAGGQYYTATLQDSNGLSTTCQSTGSQCNVTGLRCGQLYHVNVTASDDLCSSPPSATVSTNSGPCVPQHLTVQYSPSTALLSWDVTKGGANFTAEAVTLEGLMVTCETSNTSCTFPDLGCGQIYNVSVTAHNSVCSDTVASDPIKTEPCPPQNVKASLNCATHSATVSWEPSHLAVGYAAFLEGRNGHSTSCRTNHTYCSLFDLTCGTVYYVRVRAIGEVFNSSDSIGVNMTSAPCLSTSVSALVDCATDSVLVSWSSIAGAENYSVTALGSEGQTVSCSTSQNHCNISSLQCDQQFNLTFASTNQQCQMTSTTNVTFQSIPCVPQNVVSELDCSFNFITIRWNISHGAASYLVVANGPEGPVTACNTTAQQCRLQTLHCSSSYNVSVIAVNQQCNTSGSSILRINTVPCVPSHVQGSVNCTTGDLSVSWDPSMGAISYAAVAQTSGGYASVCNSTGTACVFSDLLCGMNYSLAVSATDGTCNTAQSQPVVLSTVSCKPQNASAQLNCDTNSAVVSWELSDNIKRHTVQATGSDGHRIDCSSSDHSCTLSGIHCGQSYNITVTALDGVCDNSNMHLFLQSAPCAPSNVQTSLHCDISNGGVVSVSWVQANGAESYTAVAESNNGYSYSCNTTAASCDLQELQCGQIYNVSVYSLAHGCGRVKSTTSQVQTAPCPPQNVSAIVQCDLGSVLVSWNPAVDASQFRVELESESTGTISSCNSTNTQCSIAHLPCGERFNLSVVALRGSCQSQPISDLSISSAPCIPQGVTGTVDCVTNSAWISWNVDNGTESYTVLAVRDDGHNSTCSSSNSTCNVPDLGCGRSYTFHVTASNAVCVSPPSNSFQLETAPCALSSILVVAECHSSVIMVQWQRARSGNSLYIATAEDQDRSLLSCNSSASSCNFTNVQCDKEYTIIVAASANQCSSLRSPPYKIRTAPCQPSSVQADVDCQLKDVFVSWDPSYVAQSYLLTVVGRNGDLKTCNTSDNNCTLTDLRCSNTYYVSVLASNENCTSLPSANITFQTVLCEPANLTANIQCGNSSSASLSWVGSTGAVVYTGLAQSETGTTVYCETTHTSCTLEGLVCGTVYNFTVQAKDGFCNSSLSEPQTKGAAPCPPAGLRVVPRTVENDTQILRASWSTVNCPNSEYLLALTGSIQGNSQALFDLASYWTSRRFFEVPLPCGSSYSATISARNSAATSDKSAAITGTTVPCAPLNVTFSASSVEVAWKQSLFATNYTVYGVNSSGRTKLCMTSQLLCSVTNFSGGHIVVTASNTAGESEDSVPVSVTAGRRRR